MLWLRPADLLVLLAAVAAGCATASAPAPERPARAAHPVRGDTAAPSHSPVEWTPRRIAGTARYVVRSSTTVSLTSDSAGAPAPIETRALYTLTLSGSGTAMALAGSLDSLTIHTGGRIPAAPSLRLPLLLTGHVDGSGHLVQLTAATAPSCTGGLDPAVAQAAALFPAIPRVHIGSTWQDTVAAVTCRGTLALHTLMTSSYRVAGDTTVGGREALRIVQNSVTTTASDSASASNASVTISGSGTAERTVYVDAATGLLLRLEGSSHSTVTVRTRTATLPFRQDVTETIELR